MRSSLAVAALIVALSMVPCVPAGAALVAPGGTATFSGTDPFVPPTGDVVAEDTRTITLTYDPGTETFAPGEDGMEDVTFDSQVLRDPVTQRLTFVYRLRGEPLGTVGAEAGTFTVGSFDNFLTDVSFGDGGSWTVNRSSDGDTLTATSAGFGVGTLPYLVVATDATEFNANGSIFGTFTDEFGVIDEEGGPAIAVLSAPLSISGTYQVIPLPAGVWLGMVALAGAGAVTKCRRRLRLV